MFKMKKTYTYRDNFGKEHKVKIFPDELRYVPYEMCDTGVRALRVQNICKLLVWEMHKDVTLCSKSIVCKYDESLLNKSLSRDELNKVAISEEELSKIVNSFES